MSLSIFITGTDTGIGKTYVSCELLRKFQQQGYTTLALKPLASGCRKTPTGLLNEDAEALQSLSSIKLPYSQVNPFAFEAPIAPHLAARQQQLSLSAKALADSCQNTQLADFTLIEGVGGWQVPLNANETMADFARLLAIPVVLVVGMRLGCLNHALLTASNIQAHGCNLLGWIANCIDRDMLMLEENIESLKQRIKAPLLGISPYQGKLNLAADFYAMIEA